MKPAIQSDAYDEANLVALRKRREARKTKGATVAEREHVERRSNSQHHKRRERTGRTKQLNVWCTPEIVAEVRRRAAEATEAKGKKVNPAEIVEAALLAYFGGSNG